MKTYNEKTGLEIESPDLEKGYVYPGRKKIGTEERVLEGTVTERRPEGLRQLVDVYEDCQYYHEYIEDALAALEDELVAMQPPEEPSGDTEARLAALEDELAAAKILLGVE